MHEQKDCTAVREPMMMIFGPCSKKMWEKRRQRLEIPIFSNLNLSLLDRKNNSPYANEPYRKERDGTSFCLCYDMHSNIPKVQKAASYVRLRRSPSTRAVLRQESFLSRVHTTSKYPIRSPNAKVIKRKAHVHVHACIDLLDSGVEVRDFCLCVRWQRLG